MFLFADCRTLQGIILFFPSFFTAANIANRDMRNNTSCHIFISTLQFVLNITATLDGHRLFCAIRTWNLKPVIKAREGNYFLSKGAILLHWKEKFHLQNSRRKSLWWIRVLAGSLRFNTTENLRLQAAFSFQYFVACFYAPFQSYCFRYIASFLIHGNLKFY